MKKLLLLLIVLMMLAGCGNEKLNGKVELDNSIEVREGSEGKSDKDFLEATDKKPTTIRNDNTEKWRKIQFADNKNILEYLLSYNKLYMNEDTTVHFLINFTLNTTTAVNDYGDYLLVNITEHIEKEELDAKTIGRGLELGEYKIYKDNGDIIRD